MEQSSVNHRITQFIINPSAGKKNAELIVPDIHEKWTAYQIPYHVYVTRDHADIEAGVSMAIEHGATEIVIAGGDGTILAVVNALKDVQLPIAIIPCGSGNDFARTHGIPLDPHQALAVALYRRTIRRIDVGRANGVCFLNVASLGIDARIVARTQAIKRRLSGSLVYLVASLIEIMKHRPIELHAEMDDSLYQGTVSLVAVANGRYYGGGMLIAPQANPDDGAFDVIIAAAMPRWRLLMLLPKIYSGRHLSAPEVKVYHASKIYLRESTDCPLNLDGELFDGENVRIALVPGLMQIITL